MERSMEFKFKTLGLVMMIGYVVGIVIACAVVLRDVSNSGLGLVIPVVFLLLLVFSSLLVMAAVFSSKVTISAEEISCRFFFVRTVIATSSIAWVEVESSPIISVLKIGLKDGTAKTFSLGERKDACLILYFLQQFAPINFVKATAFSAEPTPQNLQKYMVRERLAQAGLLR